MTVRENGDKMKAHTIEKEVPNMGNAEAVKRYHEKLDEFKIRHTRKRGRRSASLPQIKGSVCKSCF